MKAIVSAAVASLLIVVPSQAITTPYVDPVWRPFILLAGDGDPQQASERLQRIKQLQNTLVNNTQYDADTQQFIAGMWRSMERFDLKGFYHLLPEQKGRQRLLNVSGRWQDEVYRYRTVRQEDGGLGSDPLPLGDINLSVGVTQLQSMTLSSRYLLDGSFRVGVGASSWQTVRDAGVGILEMASYPPQQYVRIEAALEQNMRRDIRAVYPLLGSKDVDFLLPLWHAFPNLARLLVSMATIEDVVIEDDNEQGYRAYNAKLTLDQDKLKQQYPHISAYLNKVGNLLNSTIDISDDTGRLMRIGIDTTDWRVSIETVLSFGGVVPRTADGLALDRIRKFDDQPADLLVTIDSDLDVLGIRTHVRNLQARLAYQPTTDQLGLHTHINVVPAVSVEGAFLGVVPTGLIDVMIPGNIAAVITEFFKVACEGNMGRGIVAGLTLQNTPLPGVMDATAEASMLAIDNPFVQVGMRIFNTRMLPDASASEELRHLFFATQEAFYQDFDLYMARRKSSAAALGAL